MMRAIVEGVRLLVETEGYRTYFVDVPERPEYPYVLLWSTTGRERAEALSDDDDFIDDTLGLTYVAAMPDAVLDMAAVVRPLLNRTPLMTDTHSVWLRLRDSQQVQVDRSVSIPGIGNPAFAVDLFSIVADRLRTSA